MAVCSYISVPTAIPFTMQNFAVFFSFAFLGGRKGTVAVCVYLLLGIIGLPVFANGTSGIGIIMGINGGYMIGWIFSGLVVWLLESVSKNKKSIKAVSAICALAVCYICATLWYMAVYLKSAGISGLWSALSVCVFPFLVFDLIKIALALWLSRRVCLSRHISNQTRPNRVK